MSDCTKCKYAEWDCYDSSTVGQTKVLCGCKNDLVLPVKDCSKFEEVERKENDHA